MCLLVTVQRYSVIANEVKQSSLFEPINGLFSGLPRRFAPRNDETRSIEELYTQQKRHKYLTLC